MELTLEKLKYKLCYDPVTGEWRWLNPPWNAPQLTGQLAGNRRSDGYLLIRIYGRAYYSGRLAWFYMTGEWPKEEIDHIDRNPANDCWDNLREATSSQNKWNRSMYSKAGYKGVYPNGDRWQVQVDGIYYGMFDDLEKAIAFRDNKARELAGSYAILNSNIGELS